MKNLLGTLGMPMVRPMCGGMGILVRLLLLLEGIPSIQEHATHVSEEPIRTHFKIKGVAEAFQKVINTYTAPQEGNQDYDDMPPQQPEIDETCQRGQFRRRLCEFLESGDETSSTHYNLLGAERHDDYYAMPTGILISTVH